MMDLLEGVRHTEAIPGRQQGLQRAEDDGAVVAVPVLYIYIYI